VRYGILGSLAVWDDDRELPLGGPRQRAVLAILLLRANELVPTEAIVDRLWEERPPATAVKAVQVYVSQLRKALGEGAIETRPSGYLLRLDPGSLDALRFEELLAEGRGLLAGGAPGEAAAVLRRALALWRGPPLADFRYEPFARDAAARLDELRLVALEHRLAADLELGGHAEAVPELEQLVREHPLREGLHRLLVLALYRTGRQADALAAFQGARTRLREELGLEPGQALQQLERAILLQDPALDPPRAPPRPAPAPGAPPAPEQAETRKTVTVLLFAVAVDRALDPEALRHVTGLAFEAAARSVDRHGGASERVAGGEAIAVFGVPAVREDDALRAVRAALELRAGVAALEAGVRLDVRVGVETGEVVAGGPGAGLASVVGGPVAAARGLLQAAAPGEVLLGAGTHALVAHAVAAAPAAAPHAFRLESVDPDAPALVRRDDAPLVGRERELERLRALYARAASGAAQHVTVLGEPGIGKSRLARELVAGLEGEATVLVGRCPPYGEGITFWPLRELLRQAGRDDSWLAGSSHESFAAGCRALEELARGRPLVAVLDDVHWAEPTLLDFVEYAAGRLGEARVLLLCLGRPELAERRPAWVQEPAASLVLQPLSDAESLRLLESAGVPPELRPRIAEAAEGNPLFAEQLAAIAVEGGAGSELPGSIRAVLHERLDRLEAGERSLLERAAVVGRGFGLEAVLGLTPEDEREDVHARLLALARKRFVRPDLAAPEEGFRFHHVLIRDAAYDGIPKRVRAELHERVAAALEARAGEDAVVGHHLEQAFRLGAELGTPDAALGLHAGRALDAAARSAFAAGDLPAAVSLLERARAVLPAAEAAALAPRLGQALLEAGRIAEAGAVLERAVAGAAGDAVLQARSRVELQLVRLQADPAAAIRESRRVADAALRVFAGRGDEAGQCRAWCLRAFVEWIEGHAGAADDAWRRAAGHARAAGEERELFEILAWRASAAVEGAAPVAEAIETCARIRDEVGGSRVAVAAVLHPLAALHAMGGAFDEARALVREANAILDDLDRLQSAVSHREAMVELLAGDPAAAAARLGAGYDRLAEMGEKAVLATTAAMLAQALYAQGRHRAAERYCAAAERAAAAEDLSAQVTCRGVRAKLLARRGRLGEAEELARAAVALVAATDQLNRQGDALLDLAEVLRLAGDDPGADAAVRDALDRYARKGNVVSAEQARSLVATLAR